MANMKSLTKLAIALAALLIAADIASMAFRQPAGDGVRRDVASGRRITAYYLHGDFQCPTCKRMEKMSGEAMQSSFKEEIGKGTLSWRAENYQAPGNERFIKKFGVSAASLLLVEEDEGRTVRWRNLDRIWDLNEDEREFKEYVVEEAKSFIAGRPVEDSDEDGKAVSFMAALATALALGLLTAISPCPMASNIAAISFLGKNASSPWRTLLCGVLYSLGRAMAYTALGAAVVSGLLGVPELSAFLSRHVNGLIGPVFLISGLVIAGVMSFNMPGMFIPERLQRKVEGKLVFMQSFLLGSALAIAFCPSSAALFFGGLAPLAVKFMSRLCLPVSYGLATGLPVMLFAFAVALAANRVGSIFDKAMAVERWMRLAAGVTFIAAGTYYSALTITTALRGL